MLCTCRTLHLTTKETQGHDFYNQDYVIDYAIQAFSLGKCIWLMWDYGSCVTIVSKSADLGHVANILLINNYKE